MNSTSPSNAQFKRGSEVQLVLPSLKISGGVLEALKLAQDIETAGGNVRILSMWRSPHPVLLPKKNTYALSSWATRVPNALAHLPLLVFRFSRLVKLDKKRCQDWIFTHYSTLPLALLVPQHRRFIFVQGLEWSFLSNALLSKILKFFVFFVYRRSQLIAANSYLEKALCSEGLIVRGVAPIWADPVFGQTVACRRDIDILMILRKGGCKRLDLYCDAIDWFRIRAPALRIAIITTEDEIAEAIRDRVAECHLRPSGQSGMVALYRRSKILLHLSDHEGFALPPLEAMGCGCVPICRDSGGPQVYMVHPLDILLRPQAEPLPDLCIKAIELLKDPKRWECLSAASQNVFERGLSIAQQRVSKLPLLFAQSCPTPSTDRAI